MNIFRLKIVATAILIIVGAALVITFIKPESEYHNDTLTLDFGDYTIDSIKAASDSDAMSALESLCSDKGYPITYDSESNIKTINGLPGAGDFRTWQLFTLDENNHWSKYTGDPNHILVTQTRGISWGLCENGGTPTPMVDSTGASYYNLGTATRVVCLAPSCTETVCALGGENLIVGTDMYSNYPASIQYKRDLGLIAEIGSYTTPNFESIVSLDPDLVIGIASQYNHKNTILKLREIGINGVLVGDGEDLKTVYDNTYMTGVAMGMDTAARDITLKLKEQVEQTYGFVHSYHNKPSVMTALSDDKSPWVAGTNTYISDIYSKSGAKNTFEGSINGWKPVNSEVIVQKNPTLIIVISQIAATESNYNEMIANLPEEWKSTDAYANGNIYMVSGPAEDLLSRPSTRVAQLTEILGRMFHEDSFPTVIEIPKYFSDNYTDFLTYSKDL